MTVSDLVSGTEPGRDSAGPFHHSNPHPVGALWALFVGIGLLMIGNGLQASVVGIRTQSEGFSTAVAGLIMACYFVGFLAGGRAATVALATVGHIRVFAALASMASTATIVHALVVHPLSWALMRFVTGVCMAGLYIVVESWINDLATNATRGRLLALYMVVTMGSMGFGQLLLNVASPDGFDLFVIASVLVSLSLVPITLSATSTPPLNNSRGMPVIELARIIPTGLTVSFLVGLAHGTLMALGALYATSVGLRPSEVAIFVGAPMVGGVAFQLPIGWLSDRLPRRGVMVFVAALAATAGVLAMAAPPASVAAYLWMFVLGGMSYPLYSLGIAYTNDWLEPEQILGASAALVMAVGVGAVIGPLAATGLMVLFGPSQFFVVVAAVHLAVVGYLLYRIATNEAPPTDEQTPYAPFPARASATSAQLLLRGRNGRR